MKINIKWPWITIARHDKIVGEIVDDYNDAAFRTMEIKDALSQELKETQKQLAETSGKFIMWCIQMAQAGAQVRFNETKSHESYYIVTVTPDLVKPRDTPDKIMIALYESVVRTLPDRWAWNGDLFFLKEFSSIDALEKAPESIQVLTAYLQNELNLLLDTDRRMEVLLTAEKKVTGPDVRD